MLELKPVIATLDISIDGEVFHCKVDATDTTRVKLLGIATDMMAFEPDAYGEAVRNGDAALAERLAGTYADALVLFIRTAIGDDDADAVFAALGDVEPASMFGALTCIYSEIARIVGERADDIDSKLKHYMGAVDAATEPDE